MAPPIGYQAGTAWIQVLASFDGTQKDIADFADRQVMRVRVTPLINAQQFSKDLDDAARKAAHAVNLPVHVDPKQLTEGVSDAAKKAKPKVTLTPEVDAKDVEKRADSAARKAKPKIVYKSVINPSDTKKALSALPDVHRVSVIADADRLKLTVRQILNRRDLSVLQMDLDISKIQERLKLLEKVKLHKSVDVDANIAAYKGQVKSLTKERAEATINVDADIQKATVALDDLEKTLAFRIVQAERGIERAQKGLTKLRQEAQQAADDGIELDISVKEAQFRKEIDHFAARIPKLPIEFEPKISGAKNQLAELLATKQRKVIEIDADIAGVKAKLAELEAVRPHINVDVDGETAALESKLRYLETNRQTVVIKADADIVAAQTKLAAVKSQADTLGSLNTSIGVEAEDASRALAVMGSLIIAVSTLGFIAPAAAAAVALIPAAVIAAGTGLAATAMGFKGVSTAVKALQTVEDEQVSKSSANAEKRAQAAQRVTDANRSLQKAQSDADRTSEQGAAQVKAAREGVADAQSAANRRVEDAERSLSRAQADAQVAQESLNQARKEAKERLEDLRLSVAGAALDEEDAVLGVERARARLAEAQKKAKDESAAFAKSPKTAKITVSGLDLKELSLSVRQAEQSLVEVRERYGDLRQEATAASRAGIEGSQGVVAAQRAVGEANTRVGDQERALRQARSDGTRQVAKAQAQVAQAQAQAAYAAQAATERVTDAQRKLAEVSAEVGKESTGSIDKLSLAMSKLSPAGQQFATFLQDDLKPGLQGVGAAAAEEMLPKVENALTTLMELAPLAERIFADTGRVVGTLAEDFANMLTTTEWQQDLEKMGSSSNRVLLSMGDAGLGLADTFRHLSVASGPFVEGLAQSIAVGTENLATWVEMKRESGELSVWFVEMGTRIREIWADFKDLASGIWDVIEAIAPLGRIFLDVFAAFAQFIGALASANPTLFTIIAAAALLFSGFVSLFRMVGGLRKAVHDSVGVFNQMKTSLFGVKGASAEAAKAADGMTTATGKAAGATEAQIGVVGRARQRFRDFRTAIKDAYTLGADSAGKWAATTAGAAHQATGALNSVVPASQNATGALGRLQGVAQTTFVGIARGAGGAASAIGRGLGRAVGGIVGALGGLGGVALTAAVVGLGFLAQAQAEAARKAAEHEANLEELEQALVDSGGAIDDDVKQKIVDNLATASLIDNTENLGLSTEDLIRNISEGAGPTGDFAKSLEGVADEMLANNEITEDGARVLKRLVRQLVDSGGSAKENEGNIKRLGSEYQRLTGASNESTAAFESQITQLLDLAAGYHNTGKDLEGTQEEARLTTAAMEAAGLETGEFAGELDGVGDEAAGTTTPLEDMQTAITDLGDESKTAQEKVDGFKDALAELEDQSFTTEEASQEINDGMRPLPELFAAAKAAAEKLGKPLIDASGAINTTTEEGSQLQDALRDLSTSFQGEFAAALEEGRKKFKTEGEAMVYASKKTAISRDRLIDLAKQAGLTGVEVDKLIGHYRLVPSIIQSAIVTPGMNRAIIDALNLKSAVVEVPNQWQIVMSSTSPQEIELLKSLGFLVKTLPNGNILVQVDSAAARKELKYLAATDVKTIKVALQLDPRFASMTPAQRQAALKAIKFSSGGSVIPVASKAKPKPKPKPKASSRRSGVLPNADGGIREYWATGGMRPMSGRLADIVGSFSKTGVQRVIGDNPRTDEAFIPLEKTKRSLAILAEAAARLGYALKPMAAGGVIPMAGGGISGGGAAQAGNVDANPVIALGAAVDKLSANSLPALTNEVTTSTVPTLAKFEEHTGVLAVGSVGRLANSMVPLRAGFTQTTATAQGSWTKMSTSAGMSAAGQGRALGGLRSGMASTRQAMTNTASWAVTQYGRIQSAAATPIRWVLANPMNRGIIAAWNKLNTDFGLRKPIKPVPIPFAEGGRVPGFGNEDKVRAMLTPGEIVFDRTAITNLGGIAQVERFRRMARAGIVGPNKRLGGEPGDAGLRQRLMRTVPLDGLGFGFGGVQPHVARAGEEIMHKFGSLPGGIGGIGSRPNASDHPSGHALDFMTMTNVNLGNRIAGYMQANAKRLLLKYLIWQQKINQGSGWDPMEDRGSVTANHFDHVHASFLKMGAAGRDFTGAGLMGDPADYFKAAFKMLGQTNSMFPGNNAAGAAAGMARQAIAALTQYANTAALSSGTPGNVESWRPLVIRALRMLGLNPGWADITLRRMAQESGGNPRAINLWDSNAAKGTPSKGLMQTIDPTFQAYRDPRAPNDVYNPLANILASMKYAMSRYGSLPAAYGRPGGYDGGGLLPYGLQTIFHGARKPDKVLTDNQWSALISLAANNSGGGAGGDFTGNLYLSSGEFMGVVRGEIDKANTTSGLTLARRIR
jgi:chromosome segregation ATPase